MQPIDAVEIGTQARPPSPGLARPGKSNGGLEGQWGPTPNTCHGRRSPGTTGYVVSPNAQDRCVQPQWKRGTDIERDSRSPRAKNSDMVSTGNTRMTVVAS